MRGNGEDRPSHGARGLFNEKGERSMGFGINDNDWIDPPDEEPVRCGDCLDWRRCPDGCRWGWCKLSDEFTEEGYCCF